MVETRHPYRDQFDAAVTHDVLVSPLQAALDA